VAQSHHPSQRSSQSWLPALPASPSVSRPLLVTADPVLLDDLLRLAAAAGVEPELANDAVAARRAWSTAPVVLVGSDVADGQTLARLPRRDGVVLVGSDADDAGVWERAVLIGARRVAVLPDAEAELVRILADAVDGTGRGTVVAVVGGRGGAGASTTAAALALAAMRHGRRAVLIDGDPLGGGIDLVLGAEDVPGPRWPDLVSSRGHVAGAALRSALPEFDGLTVLSWDRGDLFSIPAEAMASVVGAAARGSDLTVVDLGRHADPATETALSLATLALLVVPAEVRAVAAAARVAAALQPSGADLQLLIRAPGPAALPPEIVAESLGLPLAGVIRPEPALAEAVEHGRFPVRCTRGPLADFCAGFLQTLAPAGRPAA